MQKLLWLIHPIVEHYSYGYKSYKKKRHFNQFFASKPLIALENIEDQKLKYEALRY